MRHETRRLPTNGATGGHASTPLDIRDLINVALVVASTDVAPDGTTDADVFSVKIQGTIRGGVSDSHGVWIDLSAAIVGDAFLALDRVATADLGGYSLPFTHIRAYITTKGTIEPKILVAGYNTRTD